MRSGAYLSLFLLLCSCQGAQIASEQERIAQLQKKLSELSTTEIPQKEQRLTALTEMQSRLDARRRTAKNLLINWKRSLVEIWRGHVPTMEKRLNDSGMPEALKKDVRAAQEELGSLTHEQRFSDALKRGSLTDIAPLLAGWENRTGLPEEEVEELDGSCECHLVDLKYQCNVSKDAAGWAVCVGKKKGSTEASLFGKVKETTRWWFLSDRPQQDLTVEHAFKSAVLLSRTGMKGERFIDAWGLAEDKPKHRSSLILEAKGKKADLLYLDLDSDGGEDVLHLFRDRLTALRIGPVLGDIDTWTTSRTCAAIEKLKNEKLAPFRAHCKKMKPKPKKKKDAG